MPSVRSGEYVLHFTLDAKGAVVNIQAVKAEIQKTATGMDALKKVQGPIFGVLNQLTGGLAGNLKDVYESVGGVTKGFGALKGAIIASGIGALVVGVGLLIQHFDEVRASMSAVSDETQNLADSTYEAALASEEAYKHFDLEERKLRALGVAESELIVIRRQAIDEQLAAQQLALEGQKKLVDEQLKGFAKARGATGIDAAWQYVFGTSEEDVKEALGRQKEINDKIELLEVQKLELIALEQKKAADAAKLAADQRAKDAAEIAAFEEKILTREFDEAKKLNEEKKKLLADNLADEAAAADERGVIAQKNASIVIDATQQVAAAKMIADAEAKKQDREELERKQYIAKMSVGFAMDAAASLVDLATTLSDGNEKAARKTFAVGKALSMAQAIQSTYAAVNAVLKDPTLIGPSRFIAAASAGIYGLANVAKIAKTKFNPGAGDSGSSGGGGGSSSGGGGSISTGQSSGVQAPAIDFSFLNQRNAQNPVIQAYMVPGQVSGPMEAREKIKDQSRL